LLPALAATLFAHDPITTPLTWSKEISRLFLKRCMGCHQKGGAAPFPLTSYEEARPWAVAIREETTGRTMPPWGAVKGFGDFRGDMALSGEEIQLIVDWVNGGAPEGDKTLLPAESAEPYNPARAEGRSQVISGVVRLTTSRRLIAIRPRSLDEHANVRVVLERPDTSIEPLLWIREFRPAFAHDFVFRTPVEAAKGATLHVLGPQDATFEVVSEEPQGRKRESP
jgi:hypothetical protein